MLSFLLIHIWLPFDVSDDYAFQTRETESLSFTPPLRHLLQIRGLRPDSSSIKTKQNKTKNRPNITVQYTVAGGNDVGIRKHASTARKGREILDAIRQMNRRIAAHLTILSYQSSTQQQARCVIATPDSLLLRLAT
jgi:hypothetical protein